MENYVKQNYEYMLQKLGKTVYQFQQEGVLSVTTERRIRNGDPTHISDRTINTLVDYYNHHGADLHPHHIELHDFKNTDLSKSTQPKWKNEDVEGEYVALFLSNRGTGRPKSMVFTIKETPSQTLEVRAIDMVQDPTKSMKLIQDVLSPGDLSQARERYKAQLKSNYAILRSSHFLHGEAVGRGSLLYLYLRDDLGLEMTVCTSLKTYLAARNTDPVNYSWRGGAAVATVCDLDAWPYSMIIGIIEGTYWHPEHMDICNALQRMHSYQKNENMLRLQNDIDSLWYESFMDLHRQSEDASYELE